LRLLLPRAAGDAAWVVTSSFGGGLVDGDDVALEVEVHAGATAVVTTQASTKVYRVRDQPCTCACHVDVHVHDRADRDPAAAAASPRPAGARQRTRVRVAGDGAALVVPDPVVPYRGARFEQSTEIVLDASANLVLADVVTAGRLAYGERWNAACVDSTLAIEIGGVRILHDRIVLDEADGDVAARMRRFAAIATAIVVGPKLAAPVPALPPLRRRAELIVAASPLGDGFIARVAGEDIEAVVKATRDLLKDACSRLGEDPWARKW
jgi:urease accessory protein